MRAIGALRPNVVGQPSIVLILPYFGSLPNYADLFFASCGANPTINWLLVSDQVIDAIRLPPNVALIQMTFQEFRQTVERTIGFETALETTYKLIDFKPTYGLIFADVIRQFDYWGHCDMDVIFGAIRHFMTPELLQRYNKLFIHGHFSLYRNCEEANHYFTLDAPGISFRKVFTSPKPIAFDEFGGMRSVYVHHRIPFFRDDNFIADIDRNVYQLRTVQGPNYRHQCFYWANGRLFKQFWDGDHRGRQEYLYIHLQKRRMQPPPAALVRNPQSWYITPNQFVARIVSPSSPEEIDRLNPKDFVFDLKRRVLSSLWHMKRRALLAVQRSSA